MEPGMVLSLISQGRQMLDKTEGRKDKVQLPDRPTARPTAFRALTASHVWRWTCAGRVGGRQAHQPPVTPAPAALGDGGRAMGCTGAGPLEPRLLLTPSIGNASAPPAGPVWRARADFCGTACSLGGVHHRPAK